METAAISYQGEALEAWEDEVGWTARLGEFEASSRYLDLALAELLGDGEGVHQLAAQSIAQLPHAGPMGDLVVAQPSR
jgi:hypothetical protein